MCGAKGVGKSTFLQYMTNRMLSTSVSSNISAQQCVAILDLDSGQPEFSPPGLLILSIVSKPIMSDPSMHMICSGQGCNDRDEGNVTDENGAIEQVIASFFLEVMKSHNHSEGKK
jgi:hypothetical protein